MTTIKQSGSSVSQNSERLRSSRFAGLSPEVTEWLTNGGCLRIQVKPFTDAGPSPSTCSDDDSDDLKQRDHVDSPFLRKNKVNVTSRVKYAKATSESTPVSPLRSSVPQNSNMSSCGKKPWTLPKESRELSDVSPEVPDRQTTSPCCSLPVEPFDDAGPSPSFCSDDDSDDLKLRDHVYSLFLSKSADLLQLSEESPERLGESTSSSAWLSEKTTNEIITDLLLMLTENTPEKSGQSPQTEDIDSIIQRLSDMARDNIHIDDSALKRTWKNTKKVNKAVIEDLKKEFGSAEQLLEAAVASNSSSFDEAVLRYLKIHLDALHRPIRSAAASFLSGLGINSQTH